MHVNTHTLPTIPDRAPTTGVTGAKRDDAAVQLTAVLVRGWCELQPQSTTKAVCIRVDMHVLPACLPTLYLDRHAWVERCGTTTYSSTQIKRNVFSP